MAGDTSQYVELSFLRSVSRTRFVAQKKGKKNKREKKGKGEEERSKNWSIASNYSCRCVTSPSSMCLLTYENTLSDNTAAGYCPLSFSPSGEIY